jgi:hypothetical protein
MDQPKTPLATQTAADTIDYKPLSVPAVLGLVAACLFVVLALVLFGLSLKQGDPFFLAPWTFGLPIAGAALSAVGLWQVAGSEGTRAGAKLARWGLGISLLAGVGYFTYVTFTGLAITQQANAFMTVREDNSGFLPRLIGSESDLRQAFLMSLNVAERSNKKPHIQADIDSLDMPLGSSPRGRFTLFSESPLVKAMREGDPKSVTFEPLAVQEWTFDAGAYKIRRAYRITTDELTFDMPFVFTSTEPSGEGDKRAWKVEMLRPNLQILSRTALYTKKQPFRQRAFESVADIKTGFLANFAGRRIFDVYLATQAPADRSALKEKYTTLKERTAVVALAGAAAAQALPDSAVDALAAKILPEYKPESRMAEYFDISGLRFMDPRFAEYLRDKILKPALSADRAPFLMFKSAPDDLAHCEFKDGQAHVTVSFEFSVPAVSGPGGVGEVLFLGRIVTSAPENLKVTAKDADRQFRVTHAEIYRALLVPLKKSPGQ